MADALSAAQPERQEEEDHPMPTASADNDDSPQLQQDPEQEEDEDDEADEDDEGIDLRPGAGSPGDSSEEEETDSEEEREIRKGFIVDEDESQRRKRHRKKKRSHSRRPKTEQDGADEEGSTSRKRRKDSDDESEALDEDDLELLQENLGIRRSKPKGKLRRLRRRRSVGSDGSGDDAASPPRGLNDIFADDDAAADQVENLFDADEMAGFIEDDSDDDAEARSQAGDSDEDRDDARERRNRKQKERERRKAEGAAKRRRGGLGGGRLEGVSVEAWQEVAEVFGNGQEYAWAMEDEDEDEPKPKDLKDIFEPSEIASRMLTDADEKIRLTDVPERQQLASVGLPPFEIDAEGNLAPLIPERELHAAAVWASDKVSREATQRFLLRDADGNFPALRDQFVAAVEAVLRFINVDLLEPPHIWHHRSDYIIHAPPGEEQVLLLSDHDLWKLAALSIKYRAFMARRAEFMKQYRSLQVADLHLEEVVEQAGSVEDMMDALGWLSLQYGERLAEAKLAKQEHADGEPLGVEGEEGLAAAGPVGGGAGGHGPKRTKRAVRDNEYERARKSVVKKFTELVGMSAGDLALDVAMQQKTHFPDDPEKSPSDLADEYVVVPDFPVKERVIEGAEAILVTDFGHEPILRKEARRYARDFGVVNVRPTAAGQSKIDRFNPFYAFKYLKGKPVGEFLRSPQWLQILAAEAEGLVQAEIVLPQQAEERFLGDLQRIYLSDFSSTIADEWNAMRTRILQKTVREHLVPQATLWARNMLKEEAEEVVGNACRYKLDHRLNAAPYMRADETMEPGMVPSVLAISSGRGDPKRDSVVGVFLDSDGHFREHIKIDNLFEPDEEQANQFAELLKRRRPQVVVVGGYSPATTQLLTNFRNFAARVTEELLEEGVEDDSEYDEGFPADAVAERKRNRASFESTYIYDDVARIYQNSSRATLEFPDLSTLGKYCVGLARYAQSPLNEYAALGPDISALSFDPNQKYLAKEKVSSWLERALIDVTNRVGVDINRAVRSSYYAHLLPYVSGLGPRKAELILKKINGSGGTLSTRNGLVLHGVTTKNIFVNVAGFLRIRQDDLDADLGRDAENSEDPDVLDDTRIHPEDYDVARKMAADAMDYDEEDLEGAAPSKAVTDLLADDTAKLNDLALDEFAAELTKVLNAPKRFVLYKIREELQRPFGEKRAPWFAPNAEERFTMWTGETRKTLDVGLIIPVRMLRVSQDESVLVRLDCGIDGIVGQEYRTEGAVLTRLTPGQTLQAMVMKVDYDALRVELTTRESLLEAGDTGRRQVPTDTWFDTAAAQADSQIAVKSQQKNAGGRAKRVIKHPNFQDISAGKAEEFLAGMQRGDCVIRPSSREDHLAVTWKVDEGLYQHLAVHELNKPDEYSLGTQLRISDKHRYSDLDELIDAHIKQMARKVTELTLNDRFKGSQDSLDKFLTTWTNANPGRSIYAFGWNSDRRKAGQVVLGFRTNDKVPIAHWDVSIVPEGYMLKGQVHGDVQSLVNAFKHAYLYSMQNPQAGGAPPAAGGYGGGRTPALGYGGRTPNPAMAAMQQQQQGRGTPLNGAGYGGGYGGGYGSGRTPMGGQGGQGGYGAPPPGMGGGRTPLHPSYR